MIRKTKTSDIHHNRIYWCKNSDIIFFLYLSTGNVNIYTYKNWENENFQYYSMNHVDTNSYILLYLYITTISLVIK